jgi:succinate dehydrogenase/fumarate reductase flavoprotein subunit
VAVVTEGISMGTSRNTGSDKQTYYKLTLAGREPDSVEAMAKTLFEGGAMHGDTALAEAALSARCFHKLTDIGVPFPHNRYGEYVGYKTDHDPKQRATSCGPLTSRFMTERLEARVTEKNIPVFDGYRVVSIVTEDKEKNEGGAEKRSVGLLALTSEDCEGARPRLVLFNCTNVVYATGGPSGLYRASVYPESQTCAIGTALEAGAMGTNLTESQYGIASLGSAKRPFRWNLSGSYQQVIPRYVSTDADGENPQEFLDGYFEDAAGLTGATFLKGYQWPFDPRKLGKNGSSIVDMAVYSETRIRGRRVWLDFSRNPSRADRDGRFALDFLDRTALSYLEKSGATQDTPAERLKRMNRPAYRLYLDNGIDLERELLEIAVCAQHNNGGLAVNIWWESGLRHFFPVGEAAGTLGVFRPGGSALNSTQVGSTRAAQFIASNYGEDPLSTEIFLKAAEKFVAQTKERIATLTTPRPEPQRPHELRPHELRGRYQQRMDESGAFIRQKDKVREAIRECLCDIEAFEDTYARDAGEAIDAFINWDILLTQFAYLSAIEEYIARGGKSRGSYLVCESPEELETAGYASNGFPALLDEGAFSGQVCNVRLKSEKGKQDKCPLSCSFEWLPVRPIPTGRDDWFENVCNAWNAGEIIRE